jgi:hypothetical protein
MSSRRGSTRRLTDWPTVSRNVTLTWARGEDSTETEELPPSEAHNELEYWELVISCKELVRMSIVTSDICIEVLYVVVSSSIDNPITYSFIKGCHNCKNCRIYRSLGVYTNKHAISRPLFSSMFLLACLFKLINNDSVGVENINQFVEWEFVGESLKLGEYVPQCHFVRHKFHMNSSGFEPDRHGGRQASNNISYCTILVTCWFCHLKSSWDISQCIPLEDNRRFGGKFHLRLQGCRISQEKN